MTTAERVRTIACALPEVKEMDHWGRPSFRVRKKVFATLWEADGRAMVKLAPADQFAVVQLYPEIFSPVPGTWGAQGATLLTLAKANDAIVNSALNATWCNISY